MEVKVPVNSRRKVQFPQHEAKEHPPIALLSGVDELSEALGDETTGPDGRCPEK